MNAELAFIDTNVLVYFDTDDPAKQHRAQELLEEAAERIILSTQVLGEFYVTVTRKLAIPLAPDLACQAIDDLCTLRLRPIRPELMEAAVRGSVSSQLSYWDALIVETAVDAGASALFTEDLQHGQIFNGLRVVNPFLDLA